MWKIEMASLSLLGDDEGEKEMFVTMMWKMGGTEKNTALENRWEQKTHRNKYTVP